MSILENIAEKTEPVPHTGLIKIWEAGKVLSSQSRSSRYLQFLIQALRSIRHSPVTCLITILTISLSLLILVAFLVILQNLESRINLAGQALELNIYLSDRTEPVVQQELQQQLLKIPEVAAVEFKDKKTALQDFRATLGTEDYILSGLEDENPLPASLIVKFKPGQAGEATFQAVAEKYQRHQAVEKIQYSQGAMRKIAEYLNSFRLISLGVSLLILLIAAAIITNTITLALYSRRDEIYIMRLVGASPAFVTGPCVVEGLIQGLLGSLFAIFAAYGLFKLYLRLAADAPLLNLLINQPQFLGFFQQTLILVAGVGVGVIGSYFAVRRFGASFD